MKPTFPLPLNMGREIMRCEVGSTLHGTGLPGHEDRDEMGIYLEHPTSTLGLTARPHWNFRTAGGDNRSTAADTDVICYSARKWASLALKGNPSVLLLLFAPDSAMVFCTEPGQQLRRNRAWFVSQQAGAAFLGYMTQQRKRMTGERGSAGRIRRQPGGAVDWKYAMHMLRLGHQGVEFLSTGSMSLPVPGELGDHLRAVRRGEVPVEAVLGEAESLETRVKALLAGGSPLPPHPNRPSVERWLIEAHLESWSEYERRVEARLAEWRAYYDVAGVAMASPVMDAVLAQQQVGEEMAQ